MSQSGSLRPVKDLLGKPVVHLCVYGNLWYCGVRSWWDLEYMCSPLWLQIRYVTVSITKWGAGWLFWGFTCVTCGGGGVLLWGEWLCVDWWLWGDKCDEVTWVGDVISVGVGICGAEWVDAHQLFAQMEYWMPCPPPFFTMKQISVSNRLCARSVFSHNAYSVLLHQQIQFSV